MLMKARYNPQHNTVDLQASRDELPWMWAYFPFVWWANFIYFTANGATLIMCLYHASRASYYMIEGMRHLPLPPPEEKEDERPDS